MTNLPEVGQNFCLSLSALYWLKADEGKADDGRAKCEYGYIEWTPSDNGDPGSDYFDFYDSYGNAACLDGEVVEVTDVDPNGMITMLNSEGEYNAYFSMSFEEFEVSTN